MHGYGPIVGARPLVEAIKRKLREDNGLDLTNQEVMVTAGANQVSRAAFTPRCLPLLDGWCGWGVPGHHQRGAGPVRPW